MEGVYFNLLVCLFVCVLFSRMEIAFYFDRLVKEPVPLPPLPTGGGPG